MSYKKFSADQLFDGHRFRQPDEVLITTDDGTVEAIVPGSEAGDEIVHFNGILSPGFVNCHCHLELSHMRGLIEQGTGLIDFVYKVVQQRHFPEEEILAAIEKAEDEMLANGIVAVGDICNNVLTITQKEKGRIWYHNFIEASGFLPAIAEQRFQRAVNIFREYARHYSIPVASNSIVPHAPYSVTDELWQKIIEFPGNQLMTIHNQETPAENELFQSKTGDFVTFYEKMNIDASFFIPPGKTSLQFYLSKFLPSQPIILVHNVFTSADDIIYSRGIRPAESISWCLCPNANLYITGQLPDIGLFIEQDCNIVLGTDSLASNNGLSILSEIQTIRRHLPLISTDRLLGWATINGAKALQMDSILGSFEKGKKPGIVVIEEDLSVSRRLL